MLQPFPCPTASFEVVGIDLNADWSSMDRDHCRPFDKVYENLHSPYGLRLGRCKFLCTSYFLCHGPHRTLLRDRGRTFLSALLRKSFNRLVLPTKQLQAITLRRID